MELDSAKILRMACLYVYQVAHLVLAGDSDSGSDSELDQDPAFPLPTVDSEDESSSSSPSPVQSTTAPQRGVE